MTVRPELPFVEIDPLGDLRLRVGNIEDGEAKCFRVCSNTLSRVSPVFARMLNGPFAEAKGKQNPYYPDLTSVASFPLAYDEDENPDEHKHKPWTVDIPEDNPLAFDMFARISHGFLNKIPRVLGVDQICDLMALTHYYDATHLLVPWTATWLGGPEGKGLEFSGTTDMLPKALWISWEFGRMQAFECTAKRMVVECSGVVLKDDGPLQGFPIAPDILERISAIRRQTIQAMMDIVREFTDLLVVVDEKPRWCQHATFMGPHRCESMILGSMTFCLTRAGLWPIPDADNVDLSVIDLHERLLNLVMHDIGLETAKGPDHRGCNPREFLMDKIGAVLAKIPNPVNDNHKRQLEQQARKLYG